MDMNDRALRRTVISLGGRGQGIPRETGFDITAASEVMAILCLADDREDLKRRLGNIFVGYTFGNQPIYARDLKAEGAMAALLSPCPPAVSSELPIFTTIRLAWVKSCLVTVFQPLLIHKIHNGIHQCLYALFLEC